jgi:hypothetical protein
MMLSFIENSYKNEKVGTFSVMRRKITSEKGDYMSALLFLFLTLSAFAQEFQYRAEGSFLTAAGPGSPGTPITINYTVSWNETSATLQGVYQDNYFSKTGPAILTGTVDTLGRSLKVIFTNPVNGVKSINFRTDQRANVTESIPMKIVTQDYVGNTIDNIPNTFAMMTAMQAQAAETNNNSNLCTIGFGMLTGFCGIYDGTFYEITDTRDRCNLLAVGNPRLELGTDTVFRLYLNYLPGIRSQSSHTIGAFTPSPQTTNINIASRYCDDLPGTTFGKEDCKTLNLAGDFQTGAGPNPSFSGTYSITDDTSGEACSYSFNLTRETAL